MFGSGVLTTRLSPDSSLDSFQKRRLGLGGSAKWKLYGDSRLFTSPSLIGLGVQGPSGAPSKLRLPSAFAFAAAVQLSRNLRIVSATIARQCARTLLCRILSHSALTATICLHLYFLVRQKKKIHKDPVSLLVNIESIQSVLTRRS